MPKLKSEASILATNCLGGYGDAVFPLDLITLAPQGLPSQTLCLKLVKGQPDVLQLFTPLVAKQTCIGFKA